MGDLSNKLIRQSFDGLIKTNDEDPITSTPKRLQDGVGNDLPLEVGLGGVTYYGTQDFTNATVVGGGASGTSGSSGVDGAPGTSGTSGTSAGGGGGSAAGTNPGKEYFYSASSLYKAYKYPANTLGSIGNNTQFAFATTAPAYAIPTTKWKSGDVIDELLFNVVTAYASWDGLMVALYDSEYNLDGELVIGDRLTVFTENATLLHTTGTKQLTGLNYTVPDTTSGSGVYFVVYWMNNSSGNQEHIVVKGQSIKNDFVAVWAALNFFFDNYSLQTTSSYGTIPPATGLSLEANSQSTQMLNLFR